MFRNKNCGALTIKNTGENVSLSGWIQKLRNLGGMTFIDLRDRYGITQLAFNMETDRDLCEKARSLGREFVIHVSGKVIERSNKNNNIPTGEIEIEVTNLEILNKSKTPPFTIEDETDGGEELRMKYRYLDLRRKPLKNNIILRHQVAQLTRTYLNNLDFLEIETPFLIKSTPEGARDFIVPSRMHPGEFYALPQSPQTFKQLLMVAGMDKYYQIVKCFRDEDLRADRQPEFTQIDCELSFVEKEDILKAFEGLIIFLLEKIKNQKISSFPVMEYEDAIKYYGTDKPDLRFDMKFTEINDLAQNKGFKVFDEAELVVGIKVDGCGNYSRKELDKLTDFVKKPQIGAKGLVYIKYNEDKSIKSSVDKFFSEDDIKKWIERFDANPGDLLLILAGKKKQTRSALSELRIEMGHRLGLRDPEVFKPLWVINFPLFEWDDETQRYYAMHHPFTTPVEADIEKLDNNPEKAHANAYDLVINGVEIGGGSIRIHDRALQNKIFKTLGFSEEEAQQQFGFLLGAFEYGAPPHGGIALGFDRLCALLGGKDNIRDFIAFPKNNAGKDIMIESPSEVNKNQLDELQLAVDRKNKT